MTTDPIGLEGGINLYAYVNGDPVNGGDPLGLEECYNDCPGGKWDVDIHGNVNIVIIAGGSKSRITFTCLSNNKKCTGVLDCATFGAGWDVGVGYSFEIHGEEANPMGTGTIISGYSSFHSIENYISSSWVMAAGAVGTSGNNVNVTLGLSLFVGKQYCVAENVVCE